MEVSVKLRREFPWESVGQKTLEIGLHSHKL